MTGERGVADTRRHMEHFCAADRTTRPPDGQASAKAASARRPALAAQEPGELLLRQRAREQITLAEVAIHPMQGFELRRGLDAFGNRDDPEAMRELDHGLAQPGIYLVAIAVADVAAVDLE